MTKELLVSVFKMNSFFSVGWGRNNVVMAFREETVYKKMFNGSKIEAKDNVIKVLWRKVIHGKRRNSL